MKKSRGKPINQDVIESTFDSLATGCQLIGFDWRYLYVNDAAVRQSKYARKEDLIGFTMMEKYPKIEETNMFHTLRHCMKNRSSEVIVNEFTYPDKTTAWFELRIEPVPDGLFIMSNDITERKNTEDNFRTVVESAPCSMIVSNHKGEITLVNTEAEKLFGYSRKELIGNSTEILIPHKFKLRYPKHISSFLHSTTKRTMGTGETLYAVKKDGSEFPVEVGLNPVETKDGVIVLVSIIDITQQVQLQRKLIDKQHEILNAAIEAQERERNEIGRELHDNVNQLLASIKMMLGIANSKPELQDKIITRCYGLTDECIQEIRGLTSSLVPDIVKGMDLIQSIDHIVKSLELSEKISFNTDISSQLVSQLNQKQLLTFFRITQEQINNIIKHSKANEVTISLKEVHKNVVLTIRDNGVGYEPKSSSNGIGIRNMKSRCKALKGSFSITFSKGNGCTVEACIPKDVSDVLNKTKYDFSFVDD